MYNHREDCPNRSCFKGIIICGHVRACRHCNPLPAPSPSVAIHKYLRRVASSIHPDRAKIAAHIFAAAKDRMVSLSDLKVVIQLGLARAATLGMVIASLLFGTGCRVATKKQWTRDSLALTKVYQQHDTLTLDVFRGKGVWPNDGNHEPVYIDTNWDVYRVNDLVNVGRNHFLNEEGKQYQLEEYIGTITIVDSTRIISSVKKKRWDNE